MKIAVEGCCHGELDKIYATLQRLEARQKVKIDLLICCGDFQAVRNLDDLECLACPPKYRDIRTFYKYYNGEKKAPYPTLFIGGNHEACNYLWELYYGGWVAPNIFYMGHAGVINFGGLRIGGLSGIFNGRNYDKGHFECPPYNESTMKSAYHVRELEIFRLRQLKQPLDIMLSHDWPQSISDHGNFQQLFRAKPFLEEDIRSGRLGNPHGKKLLEELKPKFWFSAHHHVKFAALVHHKQNSDLAGKRKQTESEGKKSESEKEDVLFKDSLTQFLALDKCIPKRRFLQILDFPEASGSAQFSYDEEWLAILKDTHNLLSLERNPKPLPGFGESKDFPSKESLDWVKEKMKQNIDGYRVPENFQQTVAPHDPRGNRKGKMPHAEERNPQTEKFLEMLSLPYNLQHRNSGGQGGLEGNFEKSEFGEGSEAAANPEEIELLEPEEIETNPEEIDLDDEF